jgi:hypothetical protein
MLGVSVKSLSPDNQSILVYFIVIFPFAVLSIFGWLVSCHHTKLYGPSDYRTDKGFLDAGRAVPTIEVGKRLEEELAANEPDTPLTKSDESRAESADTKTSSIVFGNRVGRSLRLTQAYLAEGLVFQALQAELGGSVQRQVTVGGLHVDGLIYSPDGAITVVEVKIISAVAPDWRRRVREGRQYLERVKSAFQAQRRGNLNLLLALVVDGNLGRLSEVRSGMLETDGMVEVRVYGLSELIERYGFGDEDKSSQGT